MIKFFKALFNKKEDFNKKFVTEMNEFALQILNELSTTSLTDEEKRDEAFDQIEIEALDRNLDFCKDDIDILIDGCLDELEEMEV